jgi:hypothetical protein
MEVKLHISLALALDGGNSQLHAYRLYLKGENLTLLTELSKWTGKEMVAVC